MSSVPARNGPVDSNLTSDPKSPERPSVKWGKRFSRLFGRDDAATAAAELSKEALPPASDSTPTDARLSDLAAPLGKQNSTRNRFSRPVFTGLPRPPTFKRQLSEKRDRLSPSDIPHSERRTVSVDRRRAFSTRPASPAALADARTSAPAVYDLSSQGSAMRAQSIPSTLPQQDLPQQANINAMLLQRPTNPPTPPPDGPSHVPEDSSRQGSTIDIQAELESKWILNLSMHFRDKSPREKFFVTYAETPTRWRRVTVSCDYRNAPPDSLEADLHALTYQRDKSSRIYEAIRTSLLDIQFYDTVTNLRLETSSDERLHVHVTEDVNEIIPYPDKHLLRHLRSIPRVSEKKVHFLNHMSGFVYKVRVDNEVLIKKEIPGPDSVEEFLYEINALSSLAGSKTVVQIRGLVVDEEAHTITGLLIDYYEKGPLVDILFDDRGSLTWTRRGKWAKQIIQGLAEIHEAGFVQGDFTVSNICVGADDNARIIDINRRGCPVGWEPPEIATMIESGQRISMYIGVKSDVFQLGMVLWAIANEDDEPERRQRPLRLTDDDEGTETDPAPSWFRHITHLCLEPQPAQRPSTNKLLDRALISRDTPQTAGSEDPLAETTTHTWASASTAVPTLNLSRYEDYKQARSPSSCSSLDDDDELPRGRSPPRNIAHLGPGSRWGGITSRSSGQSSYPNERAERSLDPSRNAHDDDEAEVHPEIIPIDPTGEGWREITVGDRGYIVRDEVYDAPPESDVVVGEDAFGRHSLHAPPIPPAPEVPRAPEPPLTSHRSFRHVDSGLGDMHVSHDLQSHYRDFDYTSANHAPSHDSYYPAPSEPFRFRHHDSGLGDMDEDDFEQLQHSSDHQHGHRTSGRRTWSWKNVGSAAAEEEEEEPLPEVREEEEAEAKGTNGRRAADGEGIFERDFETESEIGEHVGGVPLNMELNHEQQSEAVDSTPKSPNISRQERASLETLGKKSLDGSKAQAAARTFPSSTDEANEEEQQQQQKGTATEGKAH